MITKAEQRKLGKSVVLEMTPAERSFSSRKLSENLRDFIPTLKSKTDIGKDRLLGAFCPLKDELDWHVAMGESEWLPCVPVVGKNCSMEFFKISWKLLTADFMRLDIGNAFPKASPSVLVVPGLAFSKNGARLGRGKGCYDRYLLDREVFKIGVCSEAQIMEGINKDNHDVDMDVVITDQNIYKG